MTGKKPFSSQEFKAIYSKVPRLCVDLVIKTPKGVVLSLRKLPSWYGKWHLPGGTVLYKEKIAETIARVAEEELGIEVVVKKLLGYIEYPSEEKERGFGWGITMAFLCSSNMFKAKPNNDDASEIKIFEQLPKNLIEEQGDFLRSVWSEIERL